MNVTIPTYNYCQSIWNNLFVISFTGLALKIAKPFIPLSLLGGGGGGGGGGEGEGMKGGCEFLELNVTIPTTNYI